VDDLDADIIDVEYNGLPDWAYTGKQINFQTIFKKIKRCTVTFLIISNACKGLLPE
jgi:hypothetical protein